jgi:hypothetical protein
LESLSDLRCFCEYIAKKYGSPSEASEEDKAEEFRSVYLNNRPPNLRMLKVVAAACGVNVNGIDGKRLPSNIRGYYDAFEDKRNIYYRKGDTISGIENTILHEFREMIEPVFIEVCPEYNPLRTRAVHLAANRFAAAGLLPKDGFRDKIYQTGFDIGALSRIYSKSCSQVLLRMGEVLRGRIFFYGAMYELDSGSNTWTLTYWTGSNSEDAEANVYGADRFFPKKGRSVESGSLVDMAIKRNKACLVEYIKLVSEEDEGLVALASPLNGSRVALVVLLRANSDLLAPQIRRVRPILIEGFYQHL